MSVMPKDYVATESIGRDGDRIASRFHGGFHDRVPDADLERYAADASLHIEDRTFAAAVLAIRKFERACAASYGR